MTSFLRPDEQATEAEIDRAQSRDRNIKTGIKTAGAIAAGGLSSAAIAKVSPFLSKFIPADLAMKGINKVFPKLGDFLKQGQKMGLDIGEGLDYRKENFLPKKEEKKRNVIEQYSPELHQFIDQAIKKGENYLKAGSKAIKDPKFSKIIKKLEKDHGLGWWEIMESIYGEPRQEQQQPQQAQPMAQPQQQAQMQQQAPQAQGQPAPQGQPGQPGQGQQALMAILQKIQQARGGGQ
jgi:hypothetical protein